MGKIKVLKEEVSKQIAAGEVIERPASVIKELLDNSLDAGATHIYIDIINAGKTLIQVIDDGDGMDREDCLLCLETHGTSKIRNFNDLNGLNSYGFRGEALPSIASISEFYLKSKTKEQEQGTSIVCKEAIIKSVEPCSSRIGTHISIRNLFCNVPVRKKFLKSNTTEEQHINETILSIALAHPSVFFQVKVNNKTTFNLPITKNLKDRAYFLVGRELIDTLLPIKYEEGTIKIFGFIAPIGITRKTRKEQRIFINKRSIFSPPLLEAIRLAYENKIAKGSYPPCLIFFGLPQDSLDFNVHPTKKEIRFKNEDLLQEITIKAIEETLNPQIQEKEVKPKQSSFIQAEKSPISPINNTGSSPVTQKTTPPINEEKEDIAQHYSPTKKLDKKLPPTEVENYTKNKPVNSITPATANKQQIPPEQPKSLLPKNFRYIGQFEEFLVVEISQTLILINIKFARERIFFENFLGKHNDSQQYKQNLLIPLNLEISENHKKFVLKYKKELEEFGLAFEYFGGNSFILSSIPTNFHRDDYKEEVLQIIDELSHSPSKALQKDKFLIAKVMSKNLKFKTESFSPSDAKKLIQDLYHCQLPYSSPYGKPTMVSLTKNELNKRFANY